MEMNYIINEMDFKEDDICFILFVDIIECKILKVYPNSNRYKILQEGWVRMIKASNIFHTKEDVVKNLIESIEHKISILEERKQQIIIKYK